MGRRQLDTGAEVGGEDGWHDIQRELRDEDPEVEREATVILTTLLGRVRERKALRSIGALMRPARGVA